jgi:hypothetical protein
MNLVTVSPNYTVEGEMPHLIDIEERKVASVKLRLGVIQLAERDDGVLIDLQSYGYDTMGQPYRQHAYSAMSVNEMLALRDALTCMLASKFPKEAAA